MEQKLEYRSVSPESFYTDVPLPRDIFNIFQVANLELLKIELVFEKS